MKLVTADEMRALDQKAIKEYGIPGIVLMENAALAVMKVIREVLGDLPGKKITVFAGKGNNGGDGFAISRHLINNGAEVKVMLLGNPEEVSGDAKTNLDILYRLGNKIFPVVNPNSLNIVKVALGYSDLVVDAVFGTGFRGTMDQHASNIIELLNSTKGKPVIAVDVPSGLESNTGKINGACVKATHTVTFGLPKLGQVLQPGYEYCGDLRVVDISLPTEAVEQVKSNHHLITKNMIYKKLPQRPAWGHKGTFGKVLVIGGSEGLTGAAALASMSALRAGAGLVTLGLPESLNGLMEMKLTEVMTQPLPETKEKTLDLLALEEIKQLLNSCQALALGPGLSNHSRTGELVRGILKDAELPLVLDADGLNAIVSHTELFANYKGDLVLTPHPGEMARLLGIEITEVQNNRLSIAIDAAREWKSVVVLKGNRTLIATPEGKVFVNVTGNPGMGTGGTGDVLTGIIGGLMAQGLNAEDAAVTGVYIHGLAGDLAAGQKGVISMIAGDLLETLPGVIKELAMI